MHGVYRIDSGNPNGLVEALPPAICYTGRAGLWVKVNFQFDSLGWVSIVSDGVVPLDPHLMFDTVVSGNGVPSHVPQTANQLYTQKDSDPPGLVWDWWNSSWTH